MFSQSFLLDVGQEMESPQPEKKNDKCVENKSDTTKDKTVFEFGDEIEIFDDKETADNQGNDKWEEINSYTSEEKVTFGLEDEKEIFDDKESVQTQRNMNSYSELELYDYIDHDGNISNEATYARLIVILIFITVVLWFITFGQLIWILVLSRGPIVVQPFIPKDNNPFCK